MKVKRVTLKNFGPHEQIDWSCDAGVVGILGPNGSGKTHLLLALEFALAGDLPGNRKTYIRSGSTNAYVEVWFVQNNIEGRIKRFLHNSKRELDWDNKSYTKAAEVDEMFSQILGTRSESFKNTSFIRQGDMKDVLDGTETQRRNILIRLLSLSYIERRRGQLDQKIEQYAQNNLDESIYGRRDQLREQSEELNREIESLLINVQDTVFYAEDITIVQNFINQTKALKEEKLNLAAIEQQIKVQFNPEVIREHELTLYRIEKLEQELSKATQKARECAEHKQAVTRVQMLQQTLKKCEEDIKAHESILNAFRTQFVRLTDREDTENAASILKDMERKLQDARAYQALLAQYNAEKPEFEKIKVELKDYTEEGLQELNAKLSELSKTIALAGARAHVSIESYKALKATSENKEAECSGNKVACAKCSLKVIPSEMITAEAVEAAKQEADNDEAKVVRLRAEQNDLSSQLETYRAKRTSLQEKYQNLEKKITQLEDDLRRTKSDLTEEQIDELDSKIDNTKSVVSVMAEEQTKAQVAHQNTERARKELEQLELPEGIDLEKVDEELENANEVVHKLETDLEDYRKKRSETSEVYREREQMLTRKRYLRRERIPALQHSIDSYAPSENVTKLLDELNTDSFEVVYDTMVERHQEYLNKKSELRSKQATLCQYQQQMGKLESAIKKQEQHKQVLDKLREFRRLLEADGVLKSYLIYRFRHLYNTVSKNLNLLDANFVIRPCHNALSYEFRRSNSVGDDDWLDITKLSGGQKVKLSTAFLISVQETICKDVNFLVLDEPSTHLDESSVEALSSLISDLSTRMDNGNGQIWIVDHHFSLKGACSSCFYLEEKQNENE